MGINEAPPGYFQDSVLRKAVLPSFLTVHNSVLRKAVLPSFLTVHNSHSASFFTMQILQCCLQTASLRLCGNSIFKSRTIYISCIMCIKITFNRMAIPVYCPYAWTCWVDFDRTLYQCNKCNSSTLDLLHM
jgi:hypothetical protein